MSIADHLLVLASMAATAVWVTASVATVGGYASAYLRERGAA
jgi:hypothetical protein